MEGAAALDGGGLADVEAVAGFWVVLIGVGEVFVVFKKELAHVLINSLCNWWSLSMLSFLEEGEGVLHPGVAGVYLFLGVGGDEEVPERLDR